MIFSTGLNHWMLKHWNAMMGPIMSSLYVISVLALSLSRPPGDVLCNKQAGSLRYQKTTVDHLLVATMHIVQTPQTTKTPDIHIVENCSGTCSCGLVYVRHTKRASNIYIPEHKTVTYTQTWTMLLADVIIEFLMWCNFLTQMNSSYCLLLKDCCH